MESLGAHHNGRNSYIKVSLDTKEAQRKTHSNNPALRFRHLGKKKYRWRHRVRLVRTLDKGSCAKIAKISRTLRTTSSLFLASCRTWQTRGRAVVREESSGLLTVKSPQLRSVFDLQDSGKSSKDFFLKKRKLGKCKIMLRSLFTS